jgi:hypothetical protein
LQGEIAGVLAPERLLAMVQERQRLMKLVEQLGGYLRDMGITPA